MVTTPRTSAFSGSSDTASITVTAVNDAPTFFVSGDGKVTTDFADTVNSVTVQAGSNILVAGLGLSNFALARYNTDGSPDHTFSGDGNLTTPFANSSEAYSVTVQNDGKILELIGVNEFSQL